MVSNTGQLVTAAKSRNWARLFAKAIASLVGFALLFGAAAFVYFEHSVRSAALDPAQKSILEIGKPFRVPQPVPNLPVERGFPVPNSSTPILHSDRGFAGSGWRCSGRC